MKNKGLLATSIGALGVVFGDIGTSPLYAANEIFYNCSELSHNAEFILGSISLIIWALILIIFVKYIGLIFRADNDGEGGVFALYGLLYPLRKKHKSVTFMLSVLIISAGLFFSAGIITPAISVLSAVEGVKFLSLQFESKTALISILILTGLFLVQKNGTRKIGFIFGPIVIIWFLVIACLGLNQIIATPTVLKSLNPFYAYLFLKNTNLQIIFLVLAGVILAVAGGEALFADIGHFSKKSFILNWTVVAFPCLIINYMGQGAYLLSGHEIHQGSLFYSLVPNQYVGFVLTIATLTSIIASQALISGVFSLTSQGVALGLIPRIQIRYTHFSSAGQIYVSVMNWILYFGCVFLILYFETSAKLASAYGLAVAGNMFITTIAMLLISRYLWNWNYKNIVLCFSLFFIMDIMFLISNLYKVFEGAYIPTVIAIIAFIIMQTWRWGRRATFSAYSNTSAWSIHDLIKLKSETKYFLERNMILMAPKPIYSAEQKAPAIMKMIYERHGTLAKNIIFVQVVHKKIPYIDEKERYDIHNFEKSENGIIAGVAIKFGFMEEPNVEKVLEDLALHHEIQLDIKPDSWIVHLSSENVLRPRNAGMWTKIQYALYSLLRQISFPAYKYYGLGDRVNLSIEVIPVRL